MTTPEIKSGCRMKHLPAALAVFLLLSTAARSAPIIRTNDSNRVPACVTPERLMIFLREHNDKLDPKYREIARWY